MGLLSSTGSRILNSQTVGLIFFTLSSIWQARNKYIFEGTAPNPSHTISHAFASWRSFTEASNQRGELLLEKHRRFSKPSWPVCQISNLHGPTIFLLDRKIRRVSSVYFLFYLQGRCFSLGKQSNSRNLDRHLFLLTILRKILIHQSHPYNEAVTIASNKPGTLQQITTPSSARSLLLPVISDVRSYLSNGFIIARHQLQHKDFYGIFMALAPTSTIMLGLDSFISL